MLLPPPPSAPSPVAPPEPSVPTVPTPDTSAWVPWGVIEGRHTRAHPLRLESSLSKEAFLEALATRVPPLDTDLRFTTKIAKQNSDRWMDVDDAGERARLSLHIEGFTFLRVSSSAGIDGTIEQSPSGCSLDLWVRPSGLNRVANIAFGLMWAGLALVLLRAAVVSATKGEIGGVLGGLAFAACLLGIAIATIRAQRRLATRLVDELVTTVEEAAASTALTPPGGSDLPAPPTRVMTSTEREVHKAATQVRIGQPSTSAGCLPTAAVMVSAILLILGSIIVLGS